MTCSAKKEGGGGTRLKFATGVSQAKLKHEDRCDVCGGTVARNFLVCVISQRQATSLCVAECVLVCHPCQRKGFK